ncbi:MAG: hypothetical protein ACTHJW_23140 [Streptosporangiaceae bacterium]
MTSETDGAGPVVVRMSTEIDMPNADDARDRLCAEAKPGIAVVVAGLQLIALDQAATLWPSVAAVVEGSLGQTPAHAIPCSTCSLPGR